MTPTIAPPEPHGDVIDILTRLHPDDTSNNTLNRQLARPPRRFQMATLMVIIWAVFGLMLAAMVPVNLPDPIDWMQHGTRMMTYGFQIPAVLFVAGLLGPRFGTAAVALYLIAGFAGVPVFANGGGPSYIEEPTVGYLLGFLFVPWLMNRSLTRAFRGAGGMTGRIVWLGAAALIAILAVHLAGIVGLGVHILRGAVTPMQALSWITALTWPAMIYDLAFGCIALAAVRLARLLLWFCLY